MSVELRHYCRNLKCRSRLPAPIENVRKAFCCRGCHNAFYRTRCLVCEKDTGTNPLTGEKRKRLGQRKFCGRSVRTPSGARVAQVHAIKWASKPAPRATDQLAIVCAVGGGAETAIATTRSTTETA